MSPAARVAVRLTAGFSVGLGLWLLFSRPYERALAAGAEPILRLLEIPATTRLDARPGEIVVSRGDFPPASPLPGLPAEDIHFDFVILVALFAVDGRPFRPERVAAFSKACALLFLIHVAALVFEVRFLYATRLGAWSDAHYGAVARNFWAAGHHFYEVAGRFAAPFVLWWLFKAEPPRQTNQPAGWRRRRPVRLS
jgi:hypothetical protein